MSEKSIEKTYQKKSQLEHVLLRPDTYIGSVEHLSQEMWIWDKNKDRMIKKEITFVPGLYKIFDEILVNAADNKQRDQNMSCVRINIDQEKNCIKIFNNGKGIPVVEHKEEKLLIPTMIFGHLLTSSNYNDDEKKVTGGRNGFGAKLCNIFSKKFTLETSSKQYRKSFKQTWKDNMSKAEEPILKESREDDFTSVTFWPDLARFKMDCLDDDTVALLARRAYDIAASTPGVKVYLNDKKVAVNKFEDYCKLYLAVPEPSADDADIMAEPTAPVKLIYEKFGSRWEVAVACSDMGFQQISFVNSIATTKGGRHVDHVVDQVVKFFSDSINKKGQKTNTVKPFQIKNHMWLFVNCLIENPTFDSQTKENMTLQVKSFGSKCTLTEDYMKKVKKSGLLDRIQNWLAFKEKTDLEKAGSKTKMGKIKGIPKLDDANDAGGRDSGSCTLIVTEGDSAKTLAVAGLGVIGRDKYGVFPLRGKMLNVREASTKQILDNAEISNLIKIIGLNFKEKYETRDSLKQLRYGKLMIMTDQDQDGSHIKGLVINFVHHQWPNLLKHGFVEQFITPIVKVTKGKEEQSFYSMPEFEEWQNNHANWPSWKIKYYKGLGTSTSKEAKEYFSDMMRHRIKFGYGSRRDDLSIQLAFSKKFIEERKQWLTRYMFARKEHRAVNSVEEYLYQKNTKEVTFTQFVNKELILFSNMDNERSIPCLVDGFKPGQRKVLFVAFKRNLVKELKVAQLAGSVAELSAYHHGEASLMGTIINLAQNFVGSNNINLLQPIGQFGTRLHGGKDSASPRYIFTCMSTLTRLLFNPKDDPLFSYINDDGLKVEPEWYCPILPTVLINGSEGIGTGWSTKVPNYDPRQLVTNMRLMMDGRPMLPMKPYYKNFRGQLDVLDDQRVCTSGVCAVIDDNTIEITELPVGAWTQQYKENVLELAVHGDGAKVQPIISDYREYHTDTTVRFVVKMTDEQFKKAEKEGFHKVFKLQKTLSTNNMVMFDGSGVLRRYESVNQMMKEFFDIRIDFYAKRKRYIEGQLGAESLKLDNIARFIMEKISGKIKVENMKKAECVEMLKKHKYDADPVVRWKQSVARLNSLGDDDENASADGDDENEKKSDYDYLLGMPIWNLTKEKKDDILKQQETKADELGKLKKKTPSDLWKDDLDEFMEELDKVEKKEQAEEADGQLKAYKASKAMKKEPKSKKQQMSLGGSKSKDVLEYMPDKNGELIDVRIDPTLAAKKFDVKPEVKMEAGTDAERTIVDVINSDPSQMDDTQIAQFIVGMNKPAVKKSATGGGAVKKEPKEPTVKKEAKEPKDTSVNAMDKFLTKKTTTTAMKGKGKGNSDDTEDDCSVMSCESEVVERKTSSRAKAKQPASYNVGSDDSSESGSDDKIVMSSSESDDEFVARKKKTTTPAKKAEAAKENKSPVAKKTTSKNSTSVSNFFKPKTAAKKKKAVDSSDEESDDAVLELDSDSDFSASPKKATKKRTLMAKVDNQAAKKNKRIVIDSDSE